MEHSRSPTRPRRPCASARTWISTWRGAFDELLDVDVRSSKEGLGLRRRPARSATRSPFRTATILMPLPPPPADGLDQDRDSRCFSATARTAARSAGARASRARPARPPRSSGSRAARLRRPSRRSPRAEGRRTSGRRPAGAREGRRSRRGSRTRDGRPRRRSGAAASSMPLDREVADSRAGAGRSVRLVGASRRAAPSRSASE